MSQESKSDSLDAVHDLSVTATVGSSPLENQRGGWQGQTGKPGLFMPEAPPRVPRSGSGDVSGEAWSDPESLQVRQRVAEDIRDLKFLINNAQAQLDALRPVVHLVTEKSRILEAALKVHRDRLEALMAGQLELDV